MNIAEVTCHLATCIVMQGYEDKIVRDPKIEELC